MSKKSVKAALDLAERFSLRLIDHPEEFDKIPDKGILIPGPDLDIPVRRWKDLDNIHWLQNVSQAGKVPRPKKMSLHKRA